MKKRTLIVLLVVILLIASFPSYVQGVDSGHEQEPQIERSNLTGVSASLKASGSSMKAYIYAICSHPNEDILIKGYLQRLVNGSWSTYASFSESGSGSASASRTYSPPKGYTYRVKAVVNSANTGAITEYSSQLKW